MLTNIAIVDDHVLLAESIKSALQNNLSNVHINAFGSATAFLDFDFSQWQPDLVLVDILMPDINGLDMIERARYLVKPACKFMVISSISDAFTIKNAMKKGILGYVTKGAHLTELLTAIQTVLEGKKYISQSLRDDLLNYMLDEHPSAEVALSPREKEVLQRICSGRMPKEIAFDMELSLHTVQLYIKNLLRKFKFNRTTDLVAFAIQTGLYRNPRH